MISPRWRSCDRRLYYRIEENVFSYNKNVFFSAFANMNTDLPENHSKNSWKYQRRYLLIFTAYYVIFNRAIELIGRVFANGALGPEFNPRSSHTKDSKKKVLDVALLYTQHFKVSIKGKPEQSSERIAPLYHGVVALEKGAFGSLSTKVNNFTFTMRFFFFYYYFFTPARHGQLLAFSLYICL